MANSQSFLLTDRVNVSWDDLQRAAAERVRVRTKEAVRKAAPVAAAADDAMVAAIVSVVTERVSAQLPGLIRAAVEESLDVAQVRLTRDIEALIAQSVKASLSRPE